MKKNSFLFILAASLTAGFGYGQETTEQAVAEPVMEEQAVAQETVTGQEPAEAQPAAEPISEDTKKAEEPQMTVVQVEEGAEAQAAEQTAPEQVAETGNAEQGEEFVAVREEVKEEAPKPVKQPRVVFNPKSLRDPTLSPDDFLLLQYREQRRLAAIEAERRRIEEEERRKREEAERLRQLELERIKDPSREIRGKIRVSGVIGDEVFIGSKIYTIGNKVLGAKIVEVHPDYVIFSYKGHRFRKNVKL